MWQLEVFIIHDSASIADKNGESEWRGAPARHHRSREGQRECRSSGGEAPAAAGLAAGVKQRAPVLATVGVRDVRGPSRRASPGWCLPRLLPRQRHWLQLACWHGGRVGHAVRAGVWRAAVPRARRLQAAGDAGARTGLRPHRGRLGQRRPDPPVPRSGPCHRRGGRHLRTVACPGPRPVRASGVSHPVLADAEYRRAGHGLLWRHGTRSRPRVLVVGAQGRHGEQRRRAEQRCLLCHQSGHADPVHKAIGGLQQDVDRVLHGGLQGAAPVRGARLPVRNDGLVREIKLESLPACLEWWSFELLVLLSGLLPNPQLETSVLSICLNTGSLMFMVPSGLYAAISTRVSNELGAGKPEAAKLATRLVLCMALSEGLVVAVTMILLRNVWGYMYSNEEEVVTYIAQMIPVLVISFFIDGIHTSLSGVLTGCGQQKIGARVNLAAYYLVGIPMAVVLAFVLHLNGMGLWLGIVCGSLTKLLFLMWIVLSINWEDQGIKAKDMALRSSPLVA